jgi:hypothetical protein
MVKLVGAGEEGVRSVGEFVERVSFVFVGGLTGVN